MVTTDTLHLIWDLERERPTLGGSLVLRQEGELLSAINGYTTITVHVAGLSISDPLVAHLSQTVFGASAIPFSLTQSHGDFSQELAPVWPTIEERAEPGFSYFSFSRLVALHEKRQLTPRLRWQSTISNRAKAIRAHYDGKLVCLHLRYAPPYSPEESNAVGHVWNQFLRTHAKKGVLEFFLLGDDSLPPGLTLPLGAVRATDAGLDLATQLALVAHADAFLGMASGLCTAANLSDTPHVIFKHPDHHTLQMQREFGDGDRFPFAGFRQRLWRKAPSVDLLHEALDLVFS